MENIVLNFILLVLAGLCVGRLGFYIFIIFKEFVLIRFNNNENELR